MRELRAVKAAALAALLVLPTAASAALPEPVISGMVVAERNQTFSLDARFTPDTDDPPPPFIVPNLDDGRVRSKVIRAPDVRGVGSACVCT